MFMSQYGLVSTPLQEQTSQANAINLVYLKDKTAGSKLGGVKFIETILSNQVSTISLLFRITKH